MSARTIVIGDVQGCRIELEQLLEQVRYAQGVDRLILAGDLLDRGPDSAGVVRVAMEVGADAIMGNHEESHLRFKQHEIKAARDPKYKNPMKPRPPGEPHRVVAESLSDEQWLWLAKLPQYLHIDDKWTVVHAGCWPGKPVEEQNPVHLMRLRYFRKGPPLKMVSDLKEKMSAETHCYWSDLWDGPRSLVYGHHVERRGAVLTTRLSPTEVDTTLFQDEQTLVHRNRHVHTLGIDTGCCFGRRLTAAVFEDNGSVATVTAISVPARGKYAELHEDGWNSR